jgi:hypothetical protein
MYTKKIKLRKTRRGGMNPRRTASTRSVSAQPARPAVATLSKDNSRPTALQGRNNQKQTTAIKPRPEPRTPKSKLQRTPLTLQTQSVSINSPTTSLQPSLAAASPSAPTPSQPTASLQNAPQATASLQNAPQAPTSLQPTASLQNAPPATASLQNAPPATASLQNAPQAPISLQLAPPAPTSLQPAPLATSPKSTSIELEQIKTASKAALEEMKAAVDKLTKALVPSQIQTPVADIASANGSPEPLSADGKGPTSQSAASANGTGSEKVASTNAQIGEKSAPASGQPDADTKSQDLKSRATSLIEQSSTIKLETPDEIEAGTVLIRDLLNISGEIMKLNTIPENERTPLVESIKTAMAELQYKINEKKTQGTTLGGAPVPTDLYYPKNSYLTPT